MNDARERTRRALERLLANGLLTALPKRPSDQDLLATLAAAQIERHADLREAALNEKLSTWLATFCAPYGIDHVTLRRLMVDTRLLTRTRSGSVYQVNPEKSAEIDAVGAIDPAAILAQTRVDRERRKHDADAARRGPAVDGADEEPRVPPARSRQGRPAERKR